MKYRFGLQLIIVLLIALGLACKNNKIIQKEQVVDKLEKAKVYMVDKNATKETKALYKNLWLLRDKGTMFGHHESLLYGRNWNNEPGRSDVKEICGDYPAVCSLDFSKIENGATAGINGSLFDDIRRVTKEAYNRGEVITYCWHADNPLTGGNSWDNSSNNVLSEILKEGSETNIKFKGWLDNLANFANTLQDENGNMIPIIFRPFHEHTQTWNWWGKKCATEEEFVGLWKFTIKYLRDTKGIHHFIYSISPQMDNVQPKEDILYRWPGDEYVDFIGMDCYHGTNTEAFKNNLKNMKEISEEKQKPFGVTETGLEGLWHNGSLYSNYWENEMIEPLKGAKASFVILWRNEYDPNGKGSHFYGPFKGQGSEASFMKLYESPEFLFSKDLPYMYK